jgi:FkbM family methyltransferase
MIQPIDARIVSHHVGGRGFGVAFNPPDRFRSDVVHVLYEADEESVEDMSRNPDTPQGRMLEKPIVLPYCLGRSNGVASLNITANAYASSLFPPDRRFFDFYCEISIHPAVYDVTYDDMLQVVKQVQVNVHSLDELFASDRIPVRTLPDFLSLDTQGMEHDILLGAARTIRDSVLAVGTEFEVLPMYRDQPLLGDILRLMNEWGFYFAGFTNTHEVSHLRAPVGLRAKGFLGFGDALFLRRIDTLSEFCPEPDARQVKLYKLAFIALTFGYVEYALKALEAARELATKGATTGAADLQNRRYYPFLMDFQERADRASRTFPPVFGIPGAARPKGFPGSGPSWYDQHHDLAAKHVLGHHLTQASSSRGRWEAVLAYAKYRLVTEPSRSDARLRSLVRTKPLKAAAKAVYYLLNYLGLAGRPTPVPGTETHLRAEKGSSAEAEYSAIEAFLATNGFTHVADLVRERRLRSERFIFSLPPGLADIARSST